MTSHPFAMPRGRRAVAGFTLIEVLIVITIILILIGILFSIGVGAKARGMRRSTLATLKICQAAMQDYLKTNVEPTGPKSWPADYTNSGLRAYDDVQFQGPAYGASGSHFVGSDITTWVARLQSDSDAAAKLANLPRGKDILISGGTPGAGTNNTILDAWGNPIRYVASGSGGINGLSAGTNGFFMSAGPDGQFIVSSARNPATNNFLSVEQRWPTDDIYSFDPQ